MTVGINTLLLYRTGPESEGTLLLELTRVRQEISGGVQALHTSISDESGVHREAQVFMERPFHAGSQQLGNQSCHWPGCTFVHELTGMTQHVVALLSGVSSRTTFQHLCTGRDLSVRS